MARIIIIDDHPIFREGIGSMVQASDQYDLVGSLSDTDGIDALIEKTQAQIILMDLSLSSGMSYDEISRLKAKFPKIQIIVLSMFGDQPTVERAMQSGADGYALKEDAFEDLMFAIRAAQRGGRFISPSIIRQGDVSIQMDRLSIHDLPERQRQILTLVADGLSNKQIAAQLNIALPTVKNHLSTLFKRFGAQNRVSLLNKVDLPAKGQKD